MANFKRKLVLRSSPKRPGNLKREEYTFRERREVNRNPVDELEPVAVRKAVPKKKSALREASLVDVKAGLTEFLKKVRNKGFLTGPQATLFENGIENATVSSQLTEIHGEIVLAHFIRKLGGRASHEWSAGTGIDALSIPSDEFRGNFANEIDSSDAHKENIDVLKGIIRSRALYVFETKGPHATLGSSAASGNQMSAYWVAQKLVASAKDRAVAIKARLPREMAKGKARAAIQDRINWVRANSLPILIEAKSFGDGGRLPVWLGRCAILRYDDRHVDENGNAGPSVVARFNFR